MLIVTAPFHYRLKNIFPWVSTCGNDLEKGGFCLKNNLKGSNRKNHFLLVRTRQSCRSHGLRRRYGWPRRDAREPWRRSKCQWRYKVPVFPFHLPLQFFTYCPGSTFFFADRPAVIVAFMHARSLMNFDNQPTSLVL
jgi:hypothetical protein